MNFICPCCETEYEITLTPTNRPKPVPKKKKEIVPLTKYGSSGKIRMLAEKYDEIVARFGQELTDKGIFAMDNWLAANGRSYRDYGAALANWIQRDIDRNPYLLDKVPAKKAEVKPVEFDESHWT